MKYGFRAYAICAAMLLGLLTLGQATAPVTPGSPPASAPAPAPARKAAGSIKSSGGEPGGIVQVANLVYAGSMSSKCFSDHFLIQAEQDSNISTSRRFHAVKLADDELFDFPLVIMTGEGSFELTAQERVNLKSFLDRGGMLLASAS